MSGELKKEENNMSFIGIVTRKEKDTGVTLEAKIVTPKAYAIFIHNIKL